MRLISMEDILLAPELFSSRSGIEARDGSKGENAAAAPPARLAPAARKLRRLFIGFFMGPLARFQSLILARLLCQVFKEKQPGSSCHYDVEVAVPIDIHDRNSHAPARSRAVINDVPPPLNSLGRFVRFVPVDSQGFIRTRIVFMGIEAFPGYDFFPSIAVEVGQRQRVSLRPAIVHNVFDPMAPPCPILLLLVPKNSVIMAQARHQIGQTILIDVIRVNEPRCPKVKLRMEDPLAVPRLLG